MGNYSGAKKMTPQEAAALIKSGDRIYVGTASSFATTLLDALWERRAELSEVHIQSALAVKASKVYTEPDDTGRQPFLLESYFLGGMERNAAKLGKPLDFTSFHLSQLDLWVRDVAKPNVCFLEVSEPDENGYCSYGPTGGCVDEQARQSADLTILEINKQTPYINGQQGLVHISKADGYIETDDPIAAIPTGEPDEISKKISDIIMEYIPDGATFQLGLGGLSTAVGFGLMKKNELGIHSELLSEPMQMLVENGNVTNRYKGYMDGLNVFGFALGSKKMYDYMDHNVKFYSMPFSYVNDPRTIAKNKNFISINTAMSIDLFGEAASECMSYRQQSAVGGQLDYVRGAQWSEGGKSFIAMASSMVKKGVRQSKIVLSFPAGTAVTTPRSDIQYVATEYGCVNLKGLKMSDRVRAMISLAHPDFREELTEQAKDHKLI